jgi:hypothetical protein
MLWAHLKDSRTSYGFDAEDDLKIAVNNSLYGERTGHVAVVRHLTSAAGDVKEDEIHVRYLHAAEISSVTEDVDE